MKRKYFEPRNPGFVCLHCQKQVPAKRTMGTMHRNHCPFCLWSRHVDWKVAGDRSAACGEPMEPLGLTLKHEGVDKYGKKRVGELMLVHRCHGCGDYSINRLAADDKAEDVIKIFENSLKLSNEDKKIILEQRFILLEEKDRQEIMIQLYGLVPIV